MPAVEIYTSRLCPYCIRAKQLLDSKGVKYLEISVDGDDAKRQEMINKSGRKTVPQIWINQTHVGGCDDLFALERSGHLNQLLAQQ